MKFTDAAVRELILPDGTAEKIYWDDDMPGFGVRFRRHTRAGPRWIIQYRTGHHTRRITVGPVRLFSLAHAKAQAKIMLGAAYLGADPAQTRKDVAEQEAGDKREALARRIKDKALSLISRNVEPACYLYRHYHPGGDLLYVGISLEPLRRQDRHLKAATWRDMICQIVIEPFRTREEALAAEEAAIRAEFPRFNRMHNGNRHPIKALKQ